MSDEPHKERIWPVFLLATLVVVLGTWLAFASPSAPVAPGEAPEPFISPLPTFETTPADGPLALQPAVRPRTLEVDLRQERRSGEHVVRTRFTLDLVEGAVEPVGDELEWERSYGNVEITMFSDGVPLGAEVAHEVERLLETGRVRVRAHVTGEVVETEVVSAEAAQLSQVLSVIEGALDAILPRIPREPLLAGESWTWTLPLDARTADGVTLEADGKMRVSARVVGHVDDELVIELQMEGNIDLAISVAEEEVGAQTKQTGSGRGIVVWDPETGLVRSDVEWTQRGEATSTIVRAFAAKKNSTE